MSFIAAAIGGAAIIGGSMIGAKGAKDAAKTQAAAADRSAQIQKEMFEEQMQLLAPFRNIGMGALDQLSLLAGQTIDRAGSLRDYYGSDEFKMMSQQARNQQLAAAEATGGMGATSTANTLGAIAPQLGQQYLATQEAQLQDQYNRLSGLAQMGQSAAAGQASAAGQYGSGAAQAYQNAAAQQANAQLAQSQMMGNALGQLGGIAYNAYNRYNAPSTATPSFSSFSAPSTGANFTSGGMGSGAYNSIKF